MSEPAGWAWPGFPKKSSKAHYFAADSLMSLCGRWIVQAQAYRSDKNHDSAGNCAVCMSRRWKLERERKLERARS